MRFHTASLGWLALGLLTAAAPAPLAAGGPDRAAEILAQTREAIGGGRLDALKTLVLEARSERTIGNFQMNADVELTLWPGGETRRIARVGYHGSPVELL